MRLSSSIVPKLVLCLLAMAAGCATTPRQKTTEKIVLHPPQSVRDGPQFPMTDAIPGVPNFGLISKDLWRGGQPTGQGFKWLVDLGVKTVIDLRLEGEESASIPPGVRYIRIPVSPWNADRVNVNEVVREIKECPKPVFIHCHQGRDRTGLAVAAYRLSQGMSAADACKELRNFHVNFWWEAPIQRRIYELAQDAKAGRKAPAITAKLSD